MAGARGEADGALAIVRRESRRGSARRRGELCYVAKTLALLAKLGFRRRVDPGRVLGERAQQRDALPRLRGVADQLLVSAPRGQELPPRPAKHRTPRKLLLAAEGVEDVELVRRPSEASLLELAGHRDQALRQRRDVLSRRGPPPGVRTRPSVCEHAARDHDPLLVLGPELRDRLEAVLFEQVGRCVQLRLDVRLLALGADQRRVAPGAEQEADRLRQDRLAGPRLAGDRVQPRR